LDKTEQLSAQVKRLIAEPSAEARALTAASVADEFATGSLSDQERTIALEIIEIMAQDVERNVRESLSAHVKHCPFLPPSIARQLAEDVESVSLPILRFSTVLSDADLIAIVRQGNEIKQVAVAKREAVCAEVSDALVESGTETSVSALLTNQRAEITEQALKKVIDSYGGSVEIQNLMVERPTLPLTVSERLIAHVSRELRTRLVERHQIPPELAEELMRQGRERALTEVLDQDSPTAEVERLAASLHARGRLTPTLVLRALCVGDLDFFQAAMAVLADVPNANAGPLIYDHGREGLEAIYLKSGLPKTLFPAFRAAVDEVKDLAQNQWASRRMEITERIVGRLSLEYDSVCPEGLEHMLSQLSRLVGRTTPRAARSFN
jgi:uncharacterized protein (DUF2336 family)